MRLAFKAAIFAVIVVPIFSPSTRATAAEKSIIPAVASAIVIPIVAEELCTISVVNAPASTAITGL